MGPRRHHLFTAALALFGTLIMNRPAVAQNSDARIDLVAPAGTPLRVALDHTVALKHVGQVVTGTVVEPLYAYDRLVLPVGTPVTGHVTELERPSRLTRLRAWSGGDFSPKRRAVLQFDSVTRDGEAVPLQALGRHAASNVRRFVAAGAGAEAADPPKTDGTAGRAGQEIKHKANESVAAAKQQVSATIAAIRNPGRMERLKSALINQLPYHRQYLSKGTVYDAELQAPLGFGRVEPVPSAPSGTLPAPSSLLRVRLATTLDSATSPRGSRFDAVVTDPVFSTDHRLILPEGTRLSGEVTVAKRAKWFRRNGQLRFLFESVQTPERETTLLASLHSVDTSADDHIAVDEEGGARATNPKTRFIAPGLAALALAGAGDGHEHRLHGSDGNPNSQSLGGFLGFSLIGAAVARLSQPLGLTFALVGVARTAYSSVVAKGRDVRFPADTPVEIQLAPGPFQSN